MPGVEGTQRQDHDERGIGEVAFPQFPTSAKHGEKWRGPRTSVEIRATQIEAALRALQLAAAFFQRGRAVWAESRWVLENGWRYRFKLGTGRHGGAIPSCFAHVPSGCVSAHLTKKESPQGLSFKVQVEKNQNPGMNE